MTYYIRNGNTYRVTDENSVDIANHLPADNYVVKQDQFGNLFLESIDRFTPLSKYYGDTLRNADRIMNTFQDRTASTGVLLTGEKGSGKTLLAKHLSIMGYDLGIPTIVINTPWTGDSFNKLIQDIEQPLIVLFDEFEKVYDRDQQEKMLTLLDGVFASKTLFLLTCNDKWRIDSHMRNRPGRIFYALDFKGLEPAFITEYCMDELNDTSHIEQICKIASLFAEFNFDMLKALVQDMNRYNENPQEAMRLLNAKPEYDRNDVVYNVELMVDDVKIDSEDLYTDTIDFNPLVAEQITINYEAGHDDMEVATDVISGQNAPVSRSRTTRRHRGDTYVTFTPNDLKHINPGTGVFVFANDNGEKLLLTRQKPQTYNYFGAL